MPGECAGRCVAYLLLCGGLDIAGLTLLLLRLALLQERLGDEDVILGWDASVMGLERLDNGRFVLQVKNCSIAAFWIGDTSL